MNLTGRIHNILSVKLEDDMKSNRFNNMDLFTYKANSEYKKHIKTQSKAALEFINAHIDWNKLIAPIEKELPLARRGRSARGCKMFHPSKYV